MPGLFVNLNNSGGFHLVNNDNQGRFALSVSGSVGLVTNGLLYNLDMQNYTSGVTWPDSSGNGNNFTFQQVPTVVNNGSNTAYWSNIVNSIGAVAAGPIFPANTDYTKGAVIRSTTGGFGSGNIIGSDGFDTLWMNGTSILQAGNGTDFAYSTVVQNGTLSYLTWYYVSVTFSLTSGWRLFVNGQFVGASSDTTPKDLSTPLIGMYRATNYFQGSIAVAQTYTRALSHAEVYANYLYYSSRYSNGIPS